MRCKKCSKEIDVDSKYCVYCGFDNSGEWIQTKPTYIQSNSAYDSYPVQKKSQGKKYLVVAVVLIIALAGVLLIMLNNHDSGVSPPIEPIMNQANINLNVYSTHVLEKIDVTIYIDGKEAYKINQLEPLKVWNNSNPYVIKWLATSETKPITITGYSTGGGLGPTDNTQSLLLSDKNTYTVNLYL